MIEGTRFIKREKYSLCYVDTISEELKELIRNQLSSIWNGFAEVQEMPSTYTYSKTLRSFLDRYNSKRPETKKGMIGELLSHILISHFYDEFESLSILKNKEERSIKKGFDIIYCHSESNGLWYSEVKSGASESGANNSTDYNRVLLERAKNGINEMFASKRTSLWESALIDAKLTIEEGQRRIDIRNLLNEDLEEVYLNDKKNVILISTLYHDLSDLVEEDSLEAYQQEVENEDLFLDCFILSIQKRTYQAVELFLTEETTIDE